MRNNILFRKSIIIDVVIILIYILLINLKIAKVDVVIKGDGVGYYDYLPSLFIHHDLIRKDVTAQIDSLRYDRIAKKQVYVNYKGFEVNKYPAGTAVLQLPFFYFTYLTTPLNGNYNDGYQLPFQRAILYATLFYLFLSIFFLRKILELYDIKKSVIVLSQILLVFATIVSSYANFSAGTSHIYSLFAINAFLFFTKSYFTKRNLNHFVIASIFFGLIIILRQINILIFLFIPFLAGSLNDLKVGIRYVIKHPKKLFGGILLTVAVFSIQSLLWYLQTGSFLLYSYQGEGFNFLNPQIINILFSYKKGLFVYTPILFISLFGLVWLAYKRKYYLLFMWFAFFTIITYIFSSWHSWYYGCSYGSRIYIDYYGTFFILFALLLNGIPKGIKIMVLILSLLTIPVNIIQSYQYKTYILHWINMDKEKYWKVFLKTDNKYKGLLWKKKYDLNNYYTVKKVSIGNITTSAKNKSNIIYQVSSSNIPDFNKVSIIQILFDNEFAEQNNSKIIVSIRGSENNQSYYWHATYLIHFAQKQLDKWQTGLYNFKFNSITDEKEKIIRIVVNSKKEHNVLKNVKIKFFGHQ